MVHTRLATKNDLEAFRLVWREHLESQEEAGDFICATDRTLSAFECSFYQCLEPLNGVVVVAEDDGMVCGMLMRLISDVPFDFTLGKIAISLGAHVRKNFRKQGIYQSMVVLANRVLMDNGVNAVISEVLASNKLGHAASNSVGYSIEKTVRILRLNR